MTWKGINALDTHITVAIDGPSGAGKSTIARAAARRFGLIYVDTGAIYRTVGLAGVQNWPGICRRGIRRMPSMNPHRMVLHTG